MSIVKNAMRKIQEVIDLLEEIEEYNEQIIQTKDDLHFSFSDLEYEINK
jgi:glycerol-3-phosphate cytidylyltransferase-like family protein